ncbi:MAG: DAK2 domain-containing protein [Tissierellia bacterium]|nr:DAK2 domain-containing protein [Tissierellia bacterium]
MERLGSKELRAGIVAAYNNLENNKELVNSLNVFPVPDGDTGTNMSLTMKSVYNKLQSSDDDMRSVAKALGTGSLMGARGNSGVILSQLCRGVTTVLEQNDTIGVKELAEALDKARETAYKAVLKPTEGTVLTVSRMMAAFAMEKYSSYTDCIEFLEDVIDEGNEALRRTPEQLPVLKQAGVVDAGGKGLMVLLEGFLSSLTGKIIIEEPVKKLDEKFADFDDIHDHDINPEDIKFGYCTEFMINHDGSYNYEDWREVVSEYGDSLVVVGADDLIKTHIHTNNPGAVLELALQRGFLSDIKIDNMRIQNKAVNEAKHAKKQAAKTKYGFVSISIGKGFDQVFKDLGVNELISGGQTMNPSTEDIVEAVEKVNSDTVFVFPNNKNIILAAKQAVELVDKELIVVETRSIPEAFTALINFDEEEDAATNLEVMTSALSEVKTLQLTYAVRDTKVGDIDIHEGDIIGINKKDIVTNGKDVNLTMLDLLDKSIDDMTGLVTVYYGEDVSKEQAEDMLEMASKKYPDIDIEIVDGGQPLYYYIASIE